MVFIELFNEDSTFITKNTGDHYARVGLKMKTVV